MIDHGPARQPELHLRDVAMLGRAVDDDVEILAAPGRHQIVDDPTVLVEQHRIAQAAVGEHLQLAGEQCLERRVGALAVDRQLAHVADVEQPRTLTSPQMFGDDAFILDRHLIAGERHHPRAMRPVPRIERQSLDVLAFGHVAHVALLQIQVRVAPGYLAENFTRTPFCRCDLRAFPGIGSLGYPFGGPAQAGHFPDCQARAVPCA